MPARPIDKINNATNADATMVAAVAILPLNGRKPAPEEIRPPMPNCIKPSRADALPAFLENGASAIAAALGYVSPAHDSTTNRQAMVAGNPNHPLYAPVKNTIALQTCIMSVVLNTVSPDQ